jgi:hypothetical protein
MSISPVLGPAFARGWTKLPDELKVNILIRIVLPADDPIELQNQKSEYRKRLKPYLQMAPDIANLATQIYYNANTFSVSTSRRYYGTTSGALTVAFPVPLSIIKCAVWSSRTGKS